MRRPLFTFRPMTLLPLLPFLATLGCEDPADEAVAARVEESSEAASPAAATPTGDDPRQRVTFSQEGSSIEWNASKVTRAHEGRFARFHGTIFLAEDVTASAVEVDIETGSIEADVPRLTEHLRTADFFDVQRFPHAAFRSESIREGGEGGATHTVRGELELHGRTVSIEFPATIRVEERHVQVEAEFSIDRQRFGIVYAGAPDDLIRDRVVIRLSIHADRAAAA